MPRFFAGIDWASQDHAVCVVDEHGTIVDRFEVAHDHNGHQEALHRLRAFDDQVPIAIERPSGLLVDVLVEAGHPVFPIHPNAVKAMRPRYRSHGAKSDASDAYLLADTLRTDGHRFRRLKPQSDEIRALRALVRGRDDLVAARVQIANQLRSLLDSYWPGALALFWQLDSPIALAFIRRYPTPASAQRLGPKRLASFLAQHGYSGRKPIDELLDRLDCAPSACVAELEAELKGELAQSLARVLETLVDQIAAISARIEHEVAQLADGRLIMSFPRAGRICAAQILAELGSVRDRFPTDSILAAEAGLAPVTYQSGKSQAVAFRWACNHRLRKALTCFADNSRRASRWAEDVYQRARQRGCDHPHAIRILGRAWLRVLWRAWTNHTPYDPTVHRGALALG
jgi:transposase